ncbi:hypothetical protein EYF80_048305 [Liparis tanakae]|uniref:Uncharacterized protein n=1 Tax=Liparis tanakae TaxID=230148 RepID=A0A4Z2FL71_9TELE|nr:hypothetical protein EYF80_048305 [Liparis tanakae]
MQWLSWSTSPAGHWQPGTQGLKQLLSITPSGASTLKQVTGHGGPHSSNTKPLSTGQPTAAADGQRGNKEDTAQRSYTQAPYHGSGGTTRWQGLKAADFRTLQRAFAPFLAW